MLIAEQLFLLLTTDSGRAEPWATYRSFALRAGVLMDLAAARAVTVTPGKRAKVLPGPETPANPTPAEAEMLARVQRRPGRRAQAHIVDQRFRPRLIAEPLVEQGVLERRRRGFWFVRWSDYPVRDTSAEDLLRARLQQVVHGQAQETVGEGIVLLFLHTIGAHRSVLKDEIQGAVFGSVGRTAKEIRYSLIAPELDRTEPHVADAVEGLEFALYAAVQAARSSSS